MGISQIYHVARCGSTLLSHILAQKHIVYNEPSWSDCFECMNKINDYDKRQNVIVKFCSTNSSYNIDPIGNKVFLYRPLVQHLYKLKNIEQSWIKDRVHLIESILIQNNIEDLIDYKTSTEHEKFALFWVLSVIIMKNKSNVLWIKTNDFLNNKTQTVNKVCEHFNLDKIENFDILNYDVKRIRREIKPLVNREIFHNSQINLNNYYQFDRNEYGVNMDYGTIDSEIALQDKEIKNFVSIVEKSMPELNEYLY